MNSLARRAIIFILLCLGLVLLVSPTAVAAKAEISSLSASPIEVSAEQGKDTASTHITLFNSGATPVVALVELKAASTTDVSLTANPATLRVGEAKRVKLSFDGLKELDEKFEGQLIVGGTETPVAVGVEIAPAPQPSADWPLLTILVSLGVALVATFFLLLLTNAWGSLGSPAPGPEWSFGESWASTLTAAGGILGTVLGETTFPEFPQEISQTTLVNLNVLFVALLVVGPFVFQALRRPKVNASDQKAGLWGWNATLLLACMITFWAVLGEIGTLGLLCWELCGGGGVAVVFLLVALALVAILAIVYFCVTVSQLVKKDWSTEATSAVAVAAVAPAAPPAAGAPPAPTLYRWPLL